MTQGFRDKSGGYISLQCLLYFSNFKLSSICTSHSFKNQHVKWNHYTHTNANVSIPYIHVAMWQATATPGTVRQTGTRPQIWCQAMRTQYDSTKIPPQKRRRIGMSFYTLLWAFFQVITTSLDQSVFAVSILIIPCNIPNNRLLILY